MARRPAASVLSLLLVSVTLPAQDKPRQDTFTERVEVKVRTIVAIATDGAGKHLVSPLSAADLEVLEDGNPAEIVGAERMPRPRAPEASADAGRAPALAGVPLAAAPSQVLYVDPQFVYRGSANLYLKSLLAAVDSLAARGPLRIVVAGSMPRDLLASTSDAGLVRAALKKLPGEAPGTDSLFESRRILLQSPPLPNWEMIALLFIARDIERIEASLERLALWAAQNPPASPAILYFVNDGFELDPTDFYINCRGVCPPSAILLREKFRKMFANRVSRAAEQTSAQLVSLGYVVVPVTNGVMPVSRFIGAPERPNLDMRKRLSSITRPIASPTSMSLAWQPTDPLYKVAEATGGEVAVGAGSLVKAVERFDDAYAISYKSKAAGPQDLRTLEVRARRPGVLVRAARATAGAALAEKTLARGRSAAALRDGAREGALPVSLRMDGVRGAAKGGSAGTLVVVTDLAPTVENLAKIGPARARVTLAIETNDPAPFLTSQETDVDHSGEGTLWTYEIPITWPREARRVTVLVDELKTGLFGTGTLDLHR